MTKDAGARKGVIPKGGEKVWRIVLAASAGTALGFLLPDLLLAARNLCFRSGLPLRASAFLSLLATNGAALSGGALIGLIAERFEPWVAGASVLAGLAVVAVAHRDQREREPAMLLRAYALGFLTPFVLFAALGAALVAF